MSTIKSNQFAINGVIDTNKPVMQNINTLATASGCWVTFDINQGKWAVVINQAGSSIKSFTDDNIIGAITVSGTGITELYNSVQVDFPHVDLLDQKDTIVYSIAPENRFSNEQDNVLNFQLDCVNDPVQIETLAIRELKQSRIDKVIRFATDFTSLGLKAGDLIDVTSTMLGFSSKVFRILTITEEDGDDNTLVLSITAFEYDSTVYDTTGLTREERTVINDIRDKSCNTATTSSDNKAGLPLDLSGVAKALGLTLLFNNLTGRWEMTQGGQQVNIAGDHAVVKWTFQDGNDLDIRCRLYYPNVGQATIDQYIGYTGTTSQTVWPPTGTFILIWGGDNTGTGSETVYVNLEYLKDLFPTEQYFIVECRGNWYRYPSYPTVASLPGGASNNTTYLVEANGHNYTWNSGSSTWVDRGVAVGLKPVLLTATLYEGGTISGPTAFDFTVSNYSKGRFIEGVSTFIESNYGADVVGGLDGENAPGDLMGYFIFDPYNNVGYFRNDLTGL